MIIIPENWIKEPDENKTGFLQAWAESGDMSFPVPIETHNVSMKDVTLNQEQDFEFIIEGASDIQVFADKDDFNKHNDKGFAEETFVPAGLFSATDSESFCQTPRAIINGIIVETYENPLQYGFDFDDEIFTLSCLGNKFNGVIHKCPEGVDKLEVGNYISGIFWVEGWPKEESNE